MWTVSLPPSVRRRKIDDKEGPLRIEEIAGWALLESAATGILAVDAEGRIVLCNRMAEELFGYDRNELLGRSVEVLVPVGLRKQHLQQRNSYFAEPAVRPMGSGLSVIGRRKDGTEFPADIGLSLIESQSGPLAIAFVAEITSRIRAELRLRAQSNVYDRPGRRAIETLRTLTAALLRTEEQERANIATELHDDLNQRLALAIIKLDTVAEESPELSHRLGQISTELGSLLDQVQRFVYRLHPATLAQLGLHTALKTLVQDYERVLMAPVRLLVRNVPELDPQIGICLYRIAQEALQNVAKHAGRSRIRISLACNNSNLLTLTIRDYGAGFLPAKVTKGLGIISMEHRARLIGGTFSISSVIGKGTIVKILIPLGS